MPNAQDVFWLKSQFQPAIEKAIAGTPFSVDMIAGLPVRNRRDLAGARRQGLPTSRILELCVGDTIDARDDAAAGALFRGTGPTCCRRAGRSTCSRSLARA